jgi:phospholipid/cholesterol/gamma-HCH transport system substrate-binding protein
VSPALVGAFVLVLVGALIAGVLWLAAGGMTREKIDLYLAIVDESVAGLNLNAAVKFNGVDIGKVREIRLDPANPKRVRLLFAIEHGMPITVDTVAVLQTQGLTGIAFVELEGGTAGSAPLQAIPPERYPVIRSKPSLSARLENVLTSVLAKLDRTSSNIDAMLSEENRVAVSHALADVAVLARTFAARKDVIDAGIVNAARSFENGAQATEQLGPVVARIGRGAESVEKMGDAAALASAQAGRRIDAVGADLQRIGAQTLPELQRLLGELNVLSGSLRRLSEQTERNPASLLFGRSPARPGPGEAAVGGAPP